MGFRPLTAVQNIPQLLLQGDATRSASLRVLAAIILVVMLCGLIYVLRHVKTLKAGVGPKNPAGKHDRRHIMIFIACAVTFLIVCLLLFLVAKA